MHNIAIALQTDVVLVVNNRLQVIIDLQSLGKQPRARIADLIAAYVESAQTGVTAEGIDEIVKIALEPRVRQMKRLEDAILLLQHLHERVHHHGYVLALHAEGVAAHVDLLDRLVLPDRRYHLSQIHVHVWGERRKGDVK